MVANTQTGKVRSEGFLRSLLPGWTSTANSSDRYCVIAVLGSAAVGLFGLFVHGMLVKAVMVTLMLAGALFVSGTMIGFLFGVPKSRAVSDDQRPPAVGDTQAGTAPASARRNGSYTINNNLEEISDWLTKMVVGVSLVQFDALKTHVLSLAQRYGDQIGSPQLALAMIGFFFICGFMFGYLWTTLYYAAALGRAKKAADNSEVDVVAFQSLVAQTVAVTQQTNVDALRHVSDYLDPRQEPTPESTRAMQDAVKAATPEVRASILAQVGTSRSANWKNVKDVLPPMVPVLEALIDADVGDHRPHGELGFVLKDQSSPDYARSIAELTTAINLRDRANVRGWLNYEFNRALARVSATPGDKEAILGDLKKAALRWSENYQAIPALNDWMTANGVTIAQLTQAQ